MKCDNFGNEFYLALRVAGVSILHLYGLERALKDRNPAVFRELEYGRIFRYKGSINWDCKLELRAMGRDYPALNPTQSPVAMGVLVALARSEERPIIQLVSGHIYETMGNDVNKPMLEMLERMGEEIIRPPQEKKLDILPVTILGMEAL